MKRYPLFAALCMLPLLPAAATEHAAHAHDHVQATPPVAAHAARGVIREMDRQAGKLLIAHEPVPSLGWPEMTMWFALRTAVPQGLKAGDSVRIEIRQGPDRKWEIVRMERR